MSLFKDFKGLAVFKDSRCCKALGAGQAYIKLSVKGHIKQLDCILSHCSMLEKVVCGDHTWTVTRLTFYTSK